jgi:hypothetical protein
VTVITVTSFGFTVCPAPGEGQTMNFNLLAQAAGGEPPAA